MNLLLLCALYLARAIQAAPTENTTTTITSDGSEAPSLTNRTLRSIITSCALTLFACIYSAIHPNIPSPYDRSLRILWRRFGIMIMALIAPELIAAWAIRQWISARSLTTRFKASGHFKFHHPQERPDNVERADSEVPAEQYELEGHENTRALIANVKRYEGTQTLAERFKKWLKACVSEESEDYAWTQTHSFFVLMGGFMLYVDGKPHHTLWPDELLDLIRAGSIDPPILTATQMHDKSKGNAISKGLVILQVTWFVLQLISRAIYHLETTQLEAGTLAFGVFSFITYAAWWNKPLDVQCPHQVYWTLTDSKPEDHKLDGRDSQFSGIPVLATLNELIGGLNNFTTDKCRVPTCDGSINLDGVYQSILVITGFLMATIFGSIHFIACFVPFPTSQEQDLWFISVVIIICAPWVTPFIILPGTMLGNIVGTTLSKLLLAISIISYITGRVILLVLMVTTLRSLPPDAYQAVSWTSLVPHL